MTDITDKGLLYKLKLAQFEAITDPNKICPYCNENEFDLIGLKYHLENHCSAYIGINDMYDDCKAVISGKTEKE